MFIVSDSESGIHFILVISLLVTSASCLYRALSTTFISNFQWVWESAQKKYFLHENQAKYVWMFLMFIVQWFHYSCCASDCLSVILDHVCVERKLINLDITATRLKRVQAKKPWYKSINDLIKQLSSDGNLKNGPPSFNSVEMWKTTDWRFH